jgi:hypothetical protein
LALRLCQNQVTPDCICAEIQMPALLPTLAASCREISVVQITGC